MNIWSIVVIVLYTLSLGVDLAKHGQKRSGEYNHVLSLYGRIFQVNKYQEALNHLEDETIENFENKHVQTDEERKKIVKDVICLGELVDKATPKKPINQSTPVVRQGYCPNCKGELRKLGSRNEVVLEGQLYCSSCGQALDWSKK